MATLDFMPYWKRDWWREAVLTPTTMLNQQKQYIA
jgi:hypothetical protein